MVLSDGTYSFSYNEPRILWFHTDSTAWSILDEYETLMIDCRNKSGNMNQLGPWNFEMNGRLLTAIIIHGRGPTTEALHYKYMIMPNISVEAISTSWERYLFLGNNAQTLTYLKNNDEQSIFMVPVIHFFNELQYLCSMQVLLIVPLHFTTVVRWH
jgi:hypothetical protein